MASDRFEGTSPAKQDATHADSAYTSLSSLLKPSSSNKPKQAEQQKLLSPTPRRQSDLNRLYTVSERSEAGSSRNSPNFTAGEREQHDSRLMVGNDRGTSRSRSPGGAQGTKKKGNAKKSVWSLIELTISMGGAQVGNDVSPLWRGSNLLVLLGRLGGRVGIWDAVLAGSRIDGAADFARLAGRSQYV